MKIMISNQGDELIVIEDGATKLYLPPHKAKVFYSSEEIIIRDFEPERADGQSVRERHD